MLHAEDDATITRWVQSVLRSLGETAESVASGADVVERLREHPEQYKLLILDLVMPGMNGLEVLAWIRKTPETKRLRVLVTTGSLITPNEFGSDPYVVVLRKPFDTEQLRTAVSQMLLMG